MKRDLNKLSNSEYDVVVIGAGIYGVTTAWDATLRGLKVALIDKGDFGNATSSNSLKFIHGGLRYLQQLDIARMRESIHERMVLMRIAPHLVHPLPVIMPTYSYKLKSRPAMFAALLANDIIGFDRNKLNDPSKYMPKSRIISKEEVHEYIPGYNKYNMSGGALWYDCQCYNTERLLLSFVISAANAGADVANYVTAIGLLNKGNSIAGVKVQDAFTDETFDIRSKVVINNCGPWVNNILENLNGKLLKKRLKLSTAMNLVVKRKLLDKCAAGLSGPYQHIREDGSVHKAYRILFFVPWRNYTIIGTNHLPYYGNQHRYKATEVEIKNFLKAVNQAYPAANIKREEVTFFYGGFLPMVGTKPKTGEVMLLRHHALYDHLLTDHIDGLITVIGVKYTTARDVARKTVDLVFKKLNLKPPKCKTEETSLYGGNIERFEDFTNDAINNKHRSLTKTVMRHLCYNYGSDFKDILSYEKEDAEWLNTLPGSDEVLKAEIIHAVREEMAQKLADVVLRRTDLGSAEIPNEECLKEVAQIMGEELNWNEYIIKQEIEELNDIYIPVE